LSREQTREVVDAPINISQDGDEVLPTINDGISEISEHSADRGADNLNGDTGKDDVAVRLFEYYSSPEAGSPVPEVPSPVPKKSALLSPSKAAGVAAASAGAAVKHVDRVTSKDIKNKSSTRRQAIIG
jgi:hypothetical protein